MRVVAGVTDGGRIPGGGGRPRRFGRPRPPGGRVNVDHQGKTAKNSIAFSGEIAETRVITTPVEIAETRVITSPETAHVRAEIAPSMESK